MSEALRAKAGLVPEEAWNKGNLSVLDEICVIGYVHLKGGMAEEEGGRLKWKSSLEDATWPVKEVMEQVVADGTSPVVCLNPSHGEIKPDYDMDDIVKRDIDYLRRAVAGVE